MTCKDCVHYELCKYNTYQQAHYFGKDKEIYITLDNNSPCRFFKNKADFVEVKHGEWRNLYMSSPSSFVGTCSECQRSSDIPPPEQAHYCPKCGADMRKEGADNG